MLTIDNQTLFIIQSVVVSLFVVLCAQMGQLALTALMSACWILGNFFALQEATLFGFEAVTSDPFAIGATLAMTFLHEYYGKKAAEKTLIVGICMALFFVIMSIIQMSYLPNNFDTTHAHFTALLGRMPRVVFSSLFVSGCTQYLNLFLFNHLSRILGTRFFVISTCLAVMISQFFDTVLFTFCALAGNVHCITHIIIFSTCIKWLATLISLPFIQAHRSYHTRSTTNHE